MRLDMRFLADLTAPYGQVQALSPLVRRLLAQNPGPFTYTGTGTYLIGVGDGVAVIDPGPNLDSHFDALKTVLDGQKVSHIFLTHGHGDHSGLAKRFSAWANVAISANPNTQMGGAEEGSESGAAKPETTHANAQRIDLTDGQEISGADWTLKVVATPGHTSDHFCFALKEEDALFCGDHIMGWATSVIIPPDGDMGDYLGSLAKVANAKYARLYPTHGPIIEENPAAFTQMLIGHRLERDKQILELLAKEPKSVRDIVARLYAQHNKALWPAASMSIIAHLLRLEKLGQVAPMQPFIFARASFAEIAPLAQIPWTLQKQ